MKMKMRTAKKITKLLLVAISVDLAIYAWMGLLNNDFNPWNWPDSDYQTFILLCIYYFVIIPVLYFGFIESD